MIASNNNENATKLSTLANVNDDKYRNKKRDIIETKILKNFEYYFFLLAKKTKNFIKQKIKSNAKFREKYETRHATRNKIPANFPIIQKNKKDLVYKKETLRKKHTLIEHKVANQNATTTIY